MLVVVALGFGTARATLTLARQLGGSIGAAAFGWLFIILSSSDTMLAVTLIAGAILLRIGIFAAPRRRDGSASGAWQFRSSVFR